MVFGHSARLANIRNTQARDRSPVPFFLVMFMCRRNAQPPSAEMRMGSPIPTSLLGLRRLPAHTGWRGPFTAAAGGGCAGLARLLQRPVRSADCPLAQRRRCGMTLRRLASVVYGRLDLSLSRLPCSPRLTCRQKQQQKKREKSEQGKSPIALWRSHRATALASCVGAVGVVDNTAAVCYVWPSSQPSRGDRAHLA